MNKKFEDIIAERGRLVYTSEGDSMFPLIRQRDLLVIEAVRESLKVGDVPLYRRDSGQYVLHRIVDIRHGKYVMKGDNRTALEKGITDKQMIGVLTAIIRNGKTLPVETPAEYTARTANDLIYLAACAVNGDTPDRERLAQMDLPEVYRMSKNHMLTAAAAFALERTVPLPHCFDQDKKKALRKLALFEVERLTITQRLEAAGIWYLPLKGILLKDDYPNAAMREMSDNDIMVDGSRMDDVAAIMKTLDYTLDERDRDHHDVYLKPPVLVFEMHHTLFSDEKSPLFANYFADIKSKAIQNGCACHLRSEDEYLYILSHTYKHYSRGGSGLRSLLDLYVFLRAHPDMDRAYLNAELAKLQLGAFEENMRRLSQKVFTGAVLNAQEQSDLHYLIASGSMGTLENEEYNRLADNLGNDDSAASKRRYLVSRVFISGKALQKHYPFVARHKALYPLLLVYRPLKGAVTRPKGIITEYKKVKRFKRKEHS